MSTSVADPRSHPSQAQVGPATPPAGGSTLADRLLGRHRLSGRELALAGLGLSVLALATFIGHIRHGGFYFDDWGVLSIVRFPAHNVHSALSALWPYYSKRPGEVAWYSLVDSTLGFHASLQLILAGLMLTVEVVCVFAVMRMLGLATLHAVLICALVLIFPFSDSQWLWAIMSMATLASALGLLGAILAVKALESDGRRAIALHTVSLALYVVSILSYEVFAVIGCFAGAFYAYRVGLRRARVRWAVDVVVILGTLGAAKLLLPRDLATPVRATQSLSGLVHHATLIVRQGARIFSSAAIPVGAPDYRIVVGVLALLFATAAATWWLAPSSDPMRPVLGRWLTIGLLGLGVAAAAWAIYLPAIDYDSPGAQGTGNRVNGLAGVGIVVFLYACAVLLAAMLWRVATRARAATRMPGQGALAALAVAGTLLLGAGYLHRTSRDTRTWNRAIAEQGQMLGTIRQLLPSLAPQRITLYTFHHPTAVSSWVAVFRYPWDLSGALKNEYGFRGIAGVPVSRGTRFACGPGGFYPTNNGYHRGNGALYGQAYFIDVGGRRAVPVTDRASCLRLTGALRTGAAI
jgi:hypothetical protein